MMSRLTPPPPSKDDPMPWNKAMTDKEAATRIRALEEGNYDPESSHHAADKILCELLKEYGYTETVEAFENLERWYA